MARAIAIPRLTATPVAVYVNPRGDFNLAVAVIQSARYRGILACRRCRCHICLDILHVNRLPSTGHRPPLCILLCPATRKLDKGACVGTRQVA